MNQQEFCSWPVPVAVVTWAYDKGVSWVSVGVITGWLPIEKVTTRGGQLVTDIQEMGAKQGWINFYISPKRLYEENGYLWKGERR